MSKTDHADNTLIVIDGVKREVAPYDPAMNRMIAMLVFFGQSKSLGILIQLINCIVNRV